MIKDLIFRIWTSVNLSWAVRDLAWEGEMDMKASCRPALWTVE